MGRCCTGLSPHCSSPGSRVLWHSEEGRIGLGGQALYVPAASGQEGEQEAQCSPRSALPLPTWLVLLGLAKELPENLCQRQIAAQPLPLANLARVLANRPVEAAGEVFKRESAGSSQRPQRLKTEPRRAYALGVPGPDLPGLQLYCLIRGRLPEVCADMPVPLIGSAPLGSFLWF